ncbi:glycosyltransferase family 4 protein [Candidatus Gracilibacteria bacterium]|nr:glycosyltransferase family 4 protein [Candidatus Gracilibacteria bacterium]
MRIGIDARLYGPRFGGVGRYTQELIDHLARLEQEHEYILFFNEEDYSQYLAPSARFSKRRITAKKGTLEEQTGFVKDLHREQLDVMHFTNLDVPVFYKKPMIVTIHDLAEIKFPDPKKQGFLQKMQQNMMLNNINANCKRIITVSQTIKEEAIKLIGAPVDRIRIINKAISDGYKSDVYDEKLVDSLKVRLGISQPYILSVGFWHSYSNIINLIRAYNLFRNRYNTNNQLVIVGRPDDQEAAIRQVITELGLGSQVILAGFMDERDLPLLYRGAQLYINPALDDGFGSALLESMAAHVPVATANVGAVAEICGGDNAIYFEPQDITNMAEAMHHLFDDQALSKSLADKAFDQVGKYNWAETAQSTLAVYQEVAIELGVTSANAPASGGMLSNLASSVTNAASSSVNSVTQAVSNKASSLQNQGKEAINKVTNRTSK